jgi:hypothetical protein
VREFLEIADGPPGSDDGVVSVPIKARDGAIVDAVRRVAAKLLGHGPNEIFAEGLRIPPIKLYDEGRERSDVLNLLLLRVPPRRRALRARLRSAVVRGAVRPARRAGR